MVQYPAKLIISPDHRVAQLPMIDYLSTFIYFFAIIDPIGTIPIFIGVASHHEGHQRRIAFIAVGAAAAILVFFVIAGELLLTAMGISLPAFPIAGGIVMFLFAVSMIFGVSKPEAELKLTERASETAIFPLATPSIAGPGAMLASVLLTENSRYSLAEQVATTATMLIVLLVTLVMMLMASQLYRIIGVVGASIISRVMGLILASAATASTLRGIEEYFGL